MRHSNMQLYASHESHRIDNESKDAHKVKTLCRQGRIDLAVKALGLLHQQGIAASIELYGGLLQACSQRKALAEARKVHELIAASAFESDDYLNNLVIDVYIKCGSLSDGLQAFDRLENRNVLSWTALILGYTRAGQSHEAISVYKDMQNAGVKPDRQTFVSILKACGSLEEAAWLHAEVLQNKYGNDLFVGASLVAMYAKCGSMERAQGVFDNLLHRDVALWNALIAGYCQQELYGKALQLYTDMQVEGVRPNQRTFPSMLKACGSLAGKEKDIAVDRQLVKAQYLTKGKEIHAEVLKQGYELDEFVGNTLVHMYAQCGDMCSAKIVFDRLVKRDVVSWNALIGGYAEQEQGDCAFSLFAEMIREGTRPTSRTFASLLKACGSQAAAAEGTILDGQSVRMKSLFQGKNIHVEVVRMGFASDVFVGSALVYMYAKCGDLEAARHVFDTSSEQNVVSWNAMIAGYAQQEKPQMALELYLQMDGNTVQPDSWTLASALKACCGLASMEESTGQPFKVQALQAGKEVHGTLVRRGYGSDIFLENCLVEMYAKCGSLADARLVFDSSAQVDLISWNALISGYSEHEQYDHALDIYTEFRNTSGLRPDSWILASVLKVIWGLADLEVDTPIDGQFLKVDSLRIGEEIHAEVVKNGYESDVVVGAALINMYARCGDMLQARRVFDEMRHRDVTSFTAIIAGYAEHEDVDKTLQVYTLMQEAGVRPDHVTYMSMLKAFSNVGALKMCRRIHDDIVGTGKNWGSNVVTSLIHAYCKCSSIVEAQQVFDRFPERNLGSWNALIAGYARQGDHTTSLQLFEQLKIAGLEPDGVSFLCVLAACSHAGMVDKGMQLFKSMTIDYGITITSRHCTCLVDLLGRAGHLKEVEELLLRMPNQPDLTACLSLLGACRKYNDVETGRRAFEHAVSLQPRHSAAYVLMSSTYSQAHMWEDAEKMEELRQQAGAWKKPGQSWIEHEKKVHKFIVGDRSHPQSEELKAVVTELTTQMELLDLQGTVEEETG